MDQLLAPSHATLCIVFTAYLQPRFAIAYLPQPPCCIEHQQALQAATCLILPHLRRLNFRSSLSKHPRVDYSTTHSCPIQAKACSHVRRAASHHGLSLSKLAKYIVKSGKTLWRAVTFLVGLLGLL